MATLQSVLRMKGLHLPALRTWHKFIKTLKFAEIGPFVGQASAVFARMWPEFKEAERAVARDTLKYLITDHYDKLGQYSHEIADLSGLVGLEALQIQLTKHRKELTFQDTVAALMDRISNENEFVCYQGLVDFKGTCKKHDEALSKLTVGDTFDPLLGKILRTLLSVCGRTGDSWRHVRAAAFECIGVIGAVDPDRCDVGTETKPTLVKENFQEPNETLRFASEQVAYLVDAYQSSNDTKHQGALAYCIQELLKFCSYTPVFLVLPDQFRKSPQDIESIGKITPNQRDNWHRMTQKPHALEIIGPLLKSKFHTDFSNHPISEQLLPVYKNVRTYREWIRRWTLHVMSGIKSQKVQAIFQAFIATIKEGDVEVTQRILPYIVMYQLLLGSPQQRTHLRTEIVCILQDQLQASTALRPDSRLLCAEVLRLHIVQAHLTICTSLRRRHSPLWTTSITGPALKQLTWPESGVERAEARFPTTKSSKRSEHISLSLKNL